MNPTYSYLTEQSLTPIQHTRSMLYGSSLQLEHTMHPNSAHTLCYFHTLERAVHTFTRAPQTTHLLKSTRPSHMQVNLSHIMHECFTWCSYSRMDAHQATIVGDTYCCSGDQALATLHLRNIYPYPKYLPSHIHVLWPCSNIPTTCLQPHVQCCISLDCNSACPPLAKASPASTPYNSSFVTFHRLLHYSTFLPDNTRSS